MSEKLVERLRGIAEHEDALAALCDVSAGPATRASAKDHHANALTIRRAADRIEALEAEALRLRTGLKIIHKMVTGDRAPHWSDAYSTTLSRGRIAVICEDSLDGVSKSALSPSDKGE